MDLGSSHTRSVVTFPEASDGPIEASKVTVEATQTMKVSENGLCRNAQNVSIALESRQGAFLGPSSLSVESVRFRLRRRGAGWLLEEAGRSDALHGDVRGLSGL